MASIEKRLDDLEEAIQPGGQVVVLWPIEGRPGLYDYEGHAMTLEEIRRRLAPRDLVIRVDYVE